MPVVGDHIFVVIHASIQIFPNAFFSQRQEPIGLILEYDTGVNLLPTGMKCIHRGSITDYSLKPSTMHAEWGITGPLITPPICTTPPSQVLLTSPIKEEKRGIANQKASR